MEKTTRLSPKLGVLALAPVFAVLAACGGSNPAMQEQGEALAAKPADFAPLVNAAPASDTTAEAGAVAPAPDTVADAATPAPAASSADTTVAPADAVAAAPADPNAAAANGQPEKLLSMTVAVAASEGATSAATTGAPATRNPMQQPFSSNSIWNMPIGTGAQYVPAKLSGNPGNNKWAQMPGIDGEKIVLTPTAPMLDLYMSNAGWSGKNRCGATGGKVTSVPVPKDYVVPHATANNSASFLMPDKRTIVQTQPIARCKAGTSGTSMAKFPDVDLYGTGITGAHGGSGLSAIGGSIRMGELRPGSLEGPRHALKVNVYAKEALFKCTTRSACFRWPAVTADSYAVGWYGTANGNSNAAMKQGALLAIPYSRTIASLKLETTPAKQLAWTLQNYGAYIVDDTYAPGFDFSAEDGPNGKKADEFQRDWGFSMATKVVYNNAWRRDMQKIVEALYVVNNNTPSTIGGGGAPRQPLAPPIAP